MNETQRKALEELANRYDSDIDHTSTIIGPWDLPTDWISFVVFAVEPDKGPHDGRALLFGGIDPTGRIST